eukprot:XP_014003345.1 PREDICTED: centrosomal protein of 41 kDa-like [Salmo salar]
MSVLSEADVARLSEQTNGFPLPISTPVQFNNNNDAGDAGYSPRSTLQRPIQQPHVHQQCPLQSIQCSDESTGIISGQL